MDESACPMILLTAPMETLFSFFLSCDELALLMVFPELPARDCFTHSPVSSLFNSVPSSHVVLCLTVCTLSGDLWICCARGRVEGNACRVWTSRRVLTRETEKAARSHDASDVTSQTHTGIPIIPNDGFTFTVARHSMSVAGPVDNCVVCPRHRVHAPNCRANNDVLSTVHRRSGDTKQVIAAHFYNRKNF
eukprot:jgi/Bigna1/64952/fgenesh1_kg.91_\